MHCRESAKRTVAASPQGSLIVILKDNTRSTWQFRQFKAKATQTVGKVEQRHTHLHRHTFACSPPEHSTKCAPLGRAALQRAGLRTRNHSLIFAHIGTPGAHTAVSKAIFMCLHTCWPLLTHPHIQADIHTRSASAISVSAPPAGHRGSDLSLTQDAYLLTILSAGVEANRPRKEGDNTQS